MICPSCGGVGRARPGGAGFGVASLGPRGERDQAPQQQEVEYHERKVRQGGHRLDPQECSGGRR
eukprot:14848277-Alexandrium_andersonii.AAC.1